MISVIGSSQGQNTALKLWLWTMWTKKPRLKLNSIRRINSQISLKAKLLPFFVLCLIIQQLSGQHSIVRGRVTDSINQPIENVSVTVNDQGTVTDADGRYELTVIGDKRVVIVFRHISYKMLSRSFMLDRGKTLNFSPRLNLSAEKISEIILKDDDDHA